MPARTISFLKGFAISFCCLLVAQCSNDLLFDRNLNEQILPMAPLDSLATMVVQDGYRMELAAHEPLIEEPVLFTFDGNGRLYVAEMLTYMQDADGTGKFERTSRIKRLEDTDNDGVFDHYTIFADNLLLPRMIQTLDDGRILVRETNTLDLLLFTDFDGDGISDQRERVYEGGDRGGNLEHQPSGLIYGIDNWLYVTYTDKRYKFTDGKVIAEDIAYGGGQWGLAQDHLGRIYYSTAGGENPAFAFQFPSIYSRISVAGEQSEGFREVFPLDTTPDVQGGLPRLREDNTLNYFTGGGGQSIYLGGRFEDMVGDYIITEPVGNLIRRAKVVRENGFTTLINPYQQQRTEFIASTDPNFRPVWTGTAPDGSLLILDMYRGIIQEGNWTQPGSYLRSIIDQYGFDRNIGRGRLYRIVDDSYHATAQPELLSQTAAELVDSLAHENQWWRLEAQKLIVIGQHRSVIPKLKQMVRSHHNPLAKIHALWTLEGLGEIDTALLMELMNSAESDVRVTAIRISEQVLNDSEIESNWLSLAADSDIEVSQQVVLSAFYTLNEHRDQILATAKSTHGSAQGLVAIETAMAILSAQNERASKLAELDSISASLIIEGEKSYNSMCYTCHGEDGRGTVSGGSLIAPSLHNNARVGRNITSLVNLVTHGMTGPINGENYSGAVMTSIASNGDQWVANVLTYIRSSFGNEASMISAQQVADIGALYASRETPWTQSELESQFSSTLDDKANWQVTSNVESDPNRPLQLVLDGNSEEGEWGAVVPRQIGQSLVIELATAANISEVIVDSSGLSNYFSRSYSIEFSLDGVIWETIVNNEVATLLDRNQTLGHEARFVRITNQAGNTRRQWRIREISLVGKYLQ